MQFKVDRLFWAGSLSPFNVWIFKLSVSDGFIWRSTRGKGMARDKPPLSNVFTKARCLATFHSPKAMRVTGCPNSFCCIIATLHNKSVLVKAPIDMQISHKSQGPQVLEWVVLFCFTITALSVSQEGKHRSTIGPFITTVVIEYLCLVPLEEQINITVSSSLH